MANNETLIRIECPDLVAFEIRGPAPPARTYQHHFAATKLDIQTPVAFGITIERNGESFDYTPGVEVDPFLFEETAYEFIAESLDPNADKIDLTVAAPGRDLPGKLKRIGKKSVFSGSFNFRSQVGFLDLEILNGKDKLLGVGLEIFPSKIDYKTDFRLMRFDLEHEIRDLAFDIGKVTYHGASRKRVAKLSEIEWLENLRALFDDVQKGLNRIKVSPLSKIEVDEQIRRGDRAVRHGASTRRYIRRHLQEGVEVQNGAHFRAGGRGWRLPALPVEKKTLSYDTSENRFVKWALQILLRRVRSSRRRLAGEKSSQDKDEQAWVTQWKGVLENAERKLRTASDAAFLSDVSIYRLRPVQSLALHMAPGYREFFVAFLHILSGLRIQGGPFQLSEKDVHLLYEMWCFIKMGVLLRENCELPECPDWLQVDRSGIKVTLKSNKSSQLNLRSNKGESVVLTYQPNETSSTGARCEPDNLLEIRKQGSRRGFHYIFDAKYRIADDVDYCKRFGAVGPPVDTINRMHAYRDQIVYRSHNNEDEASLEPTGGMIWDLGVRDHIQKNIAAFVLYPTCDSNATNNAFYKSINQVGIGGIPFLPGEANVALVKDLLLRLTETSSETEEDRAITISSQEERERIRKTHEYGMVFILRHQQQLDYILEHGIYHTPYTQLQGVRLRADFLLFFQSRTQFPMQSGVHYMAEVKNFRIGKRNEITPNPPWPGQNGASRYVWYELGTPKKIVPSIDYRQGNRQPYFRVTTRWAFEETQRKHGTMDELSLVREPEKRLYDELCRAGFSVSVRAKTCSGPTYNIDDLRLVFNVTLDANKTVNLHFNPETGSYFLENTDLFSFHDFMLNPGKHIELLNA